MTRAASIIAGLVVLASGCTRHPTGEPSSNAAASSLAAQPAGAASLVASPAGALTAEEERAAQSIVAGDCLACHAEQMLVQQRLSPEQWAAVVKKMRRWGSLVEPSHVDTLVAFLSARYGPSAPPFVPRTIDAATAAAAVAPLAGGAYSDGDAHKGEAIYKQTCAPCHGLDARGSTIGTNLTDRPELWRAAEFAAHVKAGRGRMPAFPTCTDADIAAVLAYLRSRRPS